MFHFILFPDVGLYALQILHLENIAKTNCYYNQSPFLVSSIVFVITLFYNWPSPGSEVSDYYRDCNQLTTLPDDHTVAYILVKDPTPSLIHPNVSCRTECFIFFPFHKRWTLQKN